MKARFISPLIVRDDGGTLILADTLFYNSDVLQGTLTVRAGFPTDFASIPRPLWIILPPLGKYDAAAVCHDKLYRDGAFRRRAIARCVADQVLNEAMRASGVSPVHRWLIYAGVRLFGWIVWCHYRFHRRLLDARSA